MTNINAANTPAVGSSDRAAWREARARAIEEFVLQFCPGEHSSLYGEMILTICRLAQDHTLRGDVKILNRALKELRYAFKVFEPYRHTYKVSVFGSSRTKPDHPQYQQAVKFSQLMRESGWMVITGAGDGIMRAGNEGATREGSFGVAISLPFEQRTNDIIDGDPKLMKFKYFFTRKLLFVKEAHAVALFPGGFGTQDEGFETLTLIQTGKTNPIPIVLVNEPRGSYWQHWQKYVESELLGTGMISPEDMNLFFMTDSPEAAAREIARFYRRYDSSRWVDERLVIRLKEALPPGTVEKLNADFGDLLLEGRIEEFAEPFPDENGEQAHLPRLAMHYDKRSAGRLRMLIDRINAA